MYTNKRTIENYLSSVSIYQILIFFKVVEEGGFSNAAIDLYVSQSTISKSISKLEADLNIKLFERTTRSLYVTEEGLLLYKSWKRMIGDMNRAYLKAKNLKNSNTISIGLTNTTDHKKYFLPLKDKLDHECNNVDMIIECGSMTDLVEKLEEGYYDLIMIPDFEHYSLDDMGLPWTWVQKTPARVVVPKEHPCANRSIIEVKDILQDEFINLNGKTTGNYERDLCERFEKYNAVPKIRHTHRNSERKVFFKPSNELLFVDSFYKYESDKDTVNIPVKDEYNGIICAWNGYKRNKVLGNFLDLIHSA